MDNDATTCTLIDARCYNLAHLCPDCTTHTIPTHNELGELVDHDCPSPSSNY